MEFIVSAPPTISEAPKNTSVLRESVAVFTCCARGNPEPEIEFIVKPRISDSAEQDESYQKSIPIPGGRSLRIDMASSKHNLGFPMISVKSSKKTNNVTVMVSNPYVIDCEATLNTRVPFERTWFKDAIPIDFKSSRHRLAQNGSLMIDQVYDSDEGMYDCMIKNELGSALSNPTELKILRKQLYPELVEVTKDVQLKRGSKATLVCRAKGYPQPTVVWMTESNNELTDYRLLEAVTTVFHIDQDQTYRCVANNSLGSIKQSISLKVMPQPKRPTSVYYQERSNTSVLITWVRPQRNGIEIDSYVIRYEEESYGTKEVEMEVERMYGGRQELSYRLTGLKPSTKYSITVLSKSKKHGLSEPGENCPISLTTSEGAPSDPPGNFRQLIDSISNQPTLRWDPPNNPNGKILHYKVYDSTEPDFEMGAWSKLPVTQITETSFVVSNSDLDVRPHYYAVAAATSAGDGPLTPVISIYKKLGAPDRVENLRNVSSSRENVTLAWDQQKLKYGDLYYSYRVGYKELNARYSNTWKWDTVEREGCQIDNLKPGTEYLFVVRALNSGQVEGVPTRLVVQTLPQMNSKPLKLRYSQLRSTGDEGYKSLLINWDKPEQFPEEIKVYEVSLTTIGPRIGIQDPELNRRVRINVTGTSFDTANYLVPLKLGYIFKISVKAIGERVGGETESIFVSIEENSENLRSDTVEVHWTWDREKVKPRVEKLSHYRAIYYKDKEEPENSQYEKSTMESVTLKNLITNAEYNIAIEPVYIAADDSEQIGPRSAVKRVKVYDLARKAPSIVELYWINPRDFHIIWRLDDNQDPRHINQIIITCGQSLPSKNSYIYSPSTTQATIPAPGRSKNTNDPYLVQIKAKYMDGTESEVSRTMRVEDKQSVTHRQSLGLRCQGILPSLGFSGDSPDVGALRISWASDLKTDRVDLSIKGTRKFLNEDNQRKEADMPMIVRTLELTKDTNSQLVINEMLHANTNYEVKLEVKKSENEIAQCRTWMAPPRQVNPPKPDRFVHLSDGKKQRVAFLVDRASQELGDINTYILVVKLLPSSLQLGAEPRELDSFKNLQLNAQLEDDQKIFAVAEYDHSTFADSTMEVQVPVIGLSANLIRRSRAADSNPLKPNGGIRVNPFHVLQYGQSYAAFTLACVLPNSDGGSLNDMQETLPNKRDCRASTWSSVVTVSNPLVIIPIPNHQRTKPSTSLVTVISIVTGLALVLSIALAIGCFMRRRSKTTTTLSTKISDKLDSTLKTPLMQTINIWSIRLIQNFETLQREASNGHLTENHQYQQHVLEDGESQQAHNNSIHVNMMSPQNVDYQPASGLFA
ncbi:hypothetical protein Ciccas_001748 [Cichlidogyrus casuarinus]|uniref:Uncharacterized protein n=1 Tax=Cichlidogyrus casuarinus TaxID=1844966 RepID=A0ABD2QJ72_9PLAT